MEAMKVCCICLTAERQDYTDRAVECFLNQTFENKHLLILDTGLVPYELHRQEREVSVIRAEGMRATIGELRNFAIAAAKSADIIMHWDSDDWSAPDRIEIQEGDLHEFRGGTSSRSMLFWDTVKREAWRYTHQRSDGVIGTSLCYWRRTWEEHPFPATSMGEDTLWARKTEIVSFHKYESLMIADLHHGNTCSRIIPGAKEWERVPGWDAFCQERSLENFVRGRK